MFEKRVESLKLQEDETNNSYEEDKEEVEFLEDRENDKNNHTDKLLKTMSSEMSDVQAYDPLNKSKNNSNKMADCIWNIYLYMGEMKKVKKASGIQFITDRFIKKFKEYHKVYGQNYDQSDGSFMLRKSIFEESKMYSDEINNNIEVKKMKFEKFMLLLLLGS